MSVAASATRYRPNPDIVAQDMGGTLMLLHLRSNRFFELNRTGARLWDLLTTGQDVAQIQQQLLQEFEVSPAQLASEIEAILASLQSEELIEPAP